MAYPQTHKYTGFTLVELAVVIAIVAILAAVAVPRLMNLGDSAERAAAKDFLRQLRSAHSLYLANNRTAPSDFSDFVTKGNIQADDAYTISMFNIGKGKCSIAEKTIQCSDEDFPSLAAMGITVTYTLQDTGVSLNLED